MDFISYVCETLPRFNITTNLCCYIGLVRHSNLTEHRKDGRCLRYVENILLYIAHMESIRNFEKIKYSRRLHLR
jgi:hypothetical protein